MNRYGLKLNDMGMRQSFDQLLNRYLVGLASRFFGKDDHRVEKIHGMSLEGGNWGGSTVRSHHTFLARYDPDHDRRLNTHVDDCDVTFNVGLTHPSDYDGGDLKFYGMSGQENSNQLHHSYRHARQGRCVVHAGKRRHGVDDVEAGERAALIMWTKSLLFRSKALL